jgi:peptidoglycan/LPS O-acetylase OafA/YrhL
VWFTYLLMNALGDRKDLLNRFMSWKVVTHLGLISYGLYVYHLPMTWFVGIGLGRVHLLWLTEIRWAQNLIAAIATVVVSHFSYVWFELRFLRLKEKFNA